jgi:hypothetical protein
VSPRCDAESTGKVETMWRECVNDADVTPVQH